MQWYSVLFSQPHSPFLLAGIQVPPARRAKTLVCYGPRLVLVPPSSKGRVELHFGLLQKLKNYSPNFVGFLNSLSHQRRTRRAPNGVLWVQQLMIFSLYCLFHRQLMIFSLGLDNLFLQPPM